MRLILCAAALAAVPAVVAAAQRGVPEGQNVVVTGTRLQDYRDRLAACLARNCPPDEDIDATTALAEALFVAGEYREARAALRRSIGRNHDEAARYPEPVSDLYRANARVARHLGMDRDAQLSTRRILRSLQAGLSVEDHRHFTARLEMAQSMLAFGQYGPARRQLEELAEQARRAGRPDIAATAELRALWVGYVEDPRGGAQRRLAALAQSSDTYRSIGARMLMVRIYNERGERARANALMAELGRGSRRRQLLYNPPFELLVRNPLSNADDVQQGGSLHDSTLARRPGNMEDEWIDLGFWIQPDGSVTGLEVIRGDGARDWAEPLLESIRGRRYSRAAGNEPSYRVERYSYTSGYETRGGTHIMQRSPRARIEYFDLTEDSAPAGNAPTG